MAGVLHASSGLDEEHRPIGAALGGHAALRHAIGPGWRRGWGSPIVVCIDVRRSVQQVRGYRFVRVNRLDEKVDWMRTPPRLRPAEAALDLASGCRRPTRCGGRPGGRLPVPLRRCGRDRERAARSPTRAEPRGARGRADRCRYRDLLGPGAPLPHEGGPRPWAPGADAAGATGGRGRRQATRVSRRRVGGTVGGGRARRQVVPRQRRAARPRSGARSRRRDRRPGDGPPRVGPGVAEGLPHRASNRATSECWRDGTARRARVRSVSRRAPARRRRGLPRRRPPHPRSVRREARRPRRSSGVRRTGCRG